MNTFVKRISVYLVAALVSVGATYGTYKYMESSKPYSNADTYNYGSRFNQESVTLAKYADESYPDFTQAAEDAVHAVVHIKSITRSENKMQQQQMAPESFFDFFFGPGQRGGRSYDYSPQPQIGSGSGVIISNDGYIITNNHVIDKATELEVTLNDNQKFSAKVIGTDPNTDIALIKIEGKDFPYIPFGDSDKLKVGEWVIAIGNPFNLTSTVTKGIVSAKARGNIGGGQNSIQSFIQTDAAINPGNSGGALINTHGQLIGINTAIYSQTGNFAGYGFAVPISIAGKVVADLKEFGTVQRAMLGISIMDIHNAKDIDPEQSRNKDEKAELEKIYSKAKDIKLTEGVFVGGFAEKSPAQQAGILEGDVIISINDVKTARSSILQEQVNRFRPGDKIKVVVDRYGTKHTFDVTLKNSNGTTEVIKKVDGVASAGVVFKELSNEQKKKFGISYGVEVVDADRNGAFASKGITKGFIILEMNNTPVNSPDEAEQLIARAGASKDKVVFIKGITPSGKPQFEAIVLGE